VSRPRSAKSKRAVVRTRRPAHFKVHPKLARLLGEGYRSSEDALKELVDNAWDADAERVIVTLPAGVSKDPIVITDDGTGMSEKEVREVYLQIANDRRSRKGKHTAQKKRLVKGRKGIGKFAGLMAADAMTVETRARGVLTQLTITKADLLEAGKRDIEQVDLPVTSQACPKTEHGTTITLTGLAQTLSHPSPERLRQKLVVEYDRKEDFTVVVNGEKVAVDDIPGQTTTATVNLPGCGPVRLKFALADTPLKHAGIVVRVDGKVVGRPTMLGLDEDETIPPKLLRRVYGEIEADGLAADVTADWGAIFENSKALAAVSEWSRAEVKEKVSWTFKSEVNLQKARLKRDLDLRLAKLPENRRKTAARAIQRILEKLYAESEERIQTVVSLTLEAFENDDYWIVLKNIDAATLADVERLATALDEFGVVDLAIIGQQARSRLAFLDQFDVLVRNDATLEKQVHTAIEKNLWVLGPDHRVVTSNKSLTTLVDQWLDKKYSGSRADQRPDLFLARASADSYLLVEFKRPSHVITRTDEAQAQTYRDELAAQVVSANIELLVVGGSRDPTASAANDAPRMRVAAYGVLAANARHELAWLLQELGTE
jgi:O6-methylguanine-DNA--protein-cysteine methyltransferase